MTERIKLNRRHRSIPRCDAQHVLSIRGAGGGRGGRKIESNDGMNLILNLPVGGRGHMTDLIHDCRRSRVLENITKCIPNIATFC